MKPWAWILLTAIIAAGAAIVVSTPPDLEYNPPAISQPDLLKLSTDVRDDLIPGTEKRLTWFADEQPTEWSVVALHGFSATRQETAPLAELVAKSLGANLFETRFAGHGLKENALVGVTAEEWLDDVAEALTVGRLVGQKLVVIAVSNGAALALAMLDHPSMKSVDSLILLSPNFAPADPKAMWVTRPGGPLLLRLVSGSTRSWEALNDEQELYWTTSYPTRTVIQVIRVVDRVQEKIMTATAPRVLMLFSPNDKVLSIRHISAGYASIQSPQKEFIRIEETGSPWGHIIAGDIISPDNTTRVAQDITGFILRQAP
jgi:alpha-beta hydrolase superfamily lysophospholipase